MSKKGVTNLGIGLIIVFVVGIILAVSMTSVSQTTVKKGQQFATAGLCSGEDTDGDGLPNNLDHGYDNGRLQCPCDQDNPDGKSEEGAHIWELDTDVYYKGTKIGNKLFDNQYTHGFTQGDLDAIKAYINIKTDDSKLVLEGPGKDNLKNDDPKVVLFCPKTAATNADALKKAREAPEDKKTSEQEDLIEKCYDEFKEIYLVRLEGPVEVFSETCLTYHDTCEEMLLDDCE